MISDFQQFKCYLYLWNNTITSYHIQFNGKVKWIHFTYKVIIIVNDSIKRKQILTAFQLGLLSALRKRYKFYHCKNILVKSIWLPRESFEILKTIIDTNTFTNELQKQIKILKPFQTRQQSRKQFAHKTCICFHTQWFS